MKRLSAFASATAVAIILSGAPALAQEAAVPPVAAPAAAPAESAADTAQFLKPYGAASETCRAALERAAILSSQGKWKSAFQAIDEFDKGNVDPFALAMKISLVLRGAIRTDMDQLLRPCRPRAGTGLGDSPEQRRGLRSFRLRSPGPRRGMQAAKGVSAPGILSKELGDYYYDVIGRFSGHWSISRRGDTRKGRRAIREGLGAGVFDSASLVNQGETLVRLNRGDESDPCSRMAIALDPRDAKIHYSYALSLKSRGKKTEAIVEVDKAIKDSTAKIPRGSTR